MAGRWAWMVERMVNFVRMARRTLTVCSAFSLAIGASRSATSWIGSMPSLTFLVGQKGRCIGSVTGRFRCRNSRYGRNNRHKKEAVVPFSGFQAGGLAPRRGAFSPVPRRDVDLAGLENLTLLDG